MSIISERGTRLLGVASSVATLLIGSGATAVAADGGSLYDDLEQAYTDRCESEVRTLSRKITALNAHLLAQLPETVTQSMLPAVEAAWQRGGEARSLFQQLDDSPRKFNEWAREEALPLNVPASVVQVERWEALRPLLVPVIAGRERLGWSDLENDSPAWREKPGAWGYEIVLLLRWLVEDVADAQGYDGAWVQRESGAEFVARWAESETDSHGFLHDDYVFDVVRPAVVDGLPAHVSDAVGRLVWDGDGEGNLYAFVQRKDAFLVDLLREIAASGGRNTAAVDWFSVASRSFPPFTAMRPESNGTSDVVRAVLDREQSSVKRLVDLMKGATFDQAVARRVHDAIFWFQARLHADGTWEAPPGGWSTWTTLRRHKGRKPAAGEAAPPTSDPHPTRERPGHQIRTGPDARGPEGAWYHVCAWVADRLGGILRDTGASRVTFRVRNDTGWQLAFRAEELGRLVEEGLRERLVFESDVTAAESATDLELVVLEVVPHRRILVELRLGGRRYARERFDVHGPWPAWFASRRGPDFANPWTYGGLIPFFGVLAWTSFMARYREAAFKPWRWGLVLVVAGIVCAALMLRFAPTARPTLEVGGTVEFALPAHGAVPPPLRDLITELSVAVYRQLAHDAVDGRVGDQAHSWPERWWYALNETFRGRSRLQTVVDTDHLTELEYRVSPVAWRKDLSPYRGPIRSSHAPRFEELLRNLRYEGEPDVPSALRYGPEPGVTFVMSFSNGDHGRLTPLPDRPHGSATPILSLLLPDPSRDANPERGLNFEARERWIRERSGRTLSVMEGHGQPLRNALPNGHGIDDIERYAAAPADLEEVRRRWWNLDDRDDLQGRMVKMRNEVTQEVLRLFRGERRDTSRTALRLPAHWLRTACLCLVLLAIVPTWLQRAGFSPRWWWVPLMELLVPGALLTAGMAALYATLSPQVWAYGGALADGVVVSIRLLVAVVVGVMILHVGTWGLEAFLGGEFQDRVTRAAQRPKLNLVGLIQQSAGLLLLGTALAVWRAGAVRGAGDWLWIPSDYVSSVAAGLGLWGLGVLCLLYHGRRITTGGPS